MANVVAGSKCKYGGAVVLYSHTFVKHHLRENEMQVLIRTSVKLSVQDDILM